MLSRLKSETTVESERIQLDLLTAEQARAMRSEQARLAALCASRVEHAQANARSAAVAHWTCEYRRCAMRCRVLGERIRATPNGVDLARQRVHTIPSAREAV
jgi:hypothetical protein